MDDLLLLAWTLIKILLIAVPLIVGEAMRRGEQPEQVP